MTAVQLVKLQLHARAPHSRTVPQPSSGIAPGQGECAGKPCLINEIGLELRTAQ